jgi:hypothetical protein
MMATWEDKAHRLIAKMAMQAYEQSNRLSNGRLRKKHVPYSLPEMAHQLVAILGDHDRASAELHAKQLFLSHEGLALASKKEIR